MGFGFEIGLLSMGHGGLIEFLFSRNLALSGLCSLQSRFGGLRTEDKNGEQRTGAKGRWTEGGGTKTEERALGTEYRGQKSMTSAI